MTLGGDRYLFAHALDDFPRGTLLGATRLRTESRMTNRNGIHLAWHANNHRIRQILCDANGVQRGRHDDQFQFRSNRLLDATNHAKQDIALERTFMKLVENHDVDFRQNSIALQFAQQDTWCHCRQACFARCLSIESHLVTDQSAQANALFHGDARGSCPRRNAPRFDKHDASIALGQSNQGWRYARCLPSARRSFHDDGRPSCNGRDDLVES